jgi:hypothetical protein
VTKVTVVVKVLNLIRKPINRASNVDLEKKINRKQNSTVVLLSSCEFKAVCVITLLTALTHIAIAVQHGGPVAVPDVPAYLSITQWIGGSFLPEDLAFHPGYGMLLAPVLFVTGTDGTAIHTASLILNSIAAGAIVWLSVRFAAINGLSVNVAVLVALIAALHPSVSSASRIGWPETFLTLVLLLIANALSAPTICRWVSSGLLSGLVISLHPRAIVIAVGLSAIGLLTKNLKPLLIGLLPGSAATVVALTLTHTWPMSRVAAIHQVGDGADPVTAALGQLLAVTAGTLGLAMCGLLVGFCAAWEIIYKKNVDDLAQAFLAITALGMIMLGGLALAGGNHIDVILYGRYLDPWALPLSLVAISALPKRLASKRLLLAGTTLVIVSVAVVLISSDVMNLPIRRIMTLSLSSIWILANQNIVIVALLAGLISVFGLFVIASNSETYVKALIIALITLSLCSTYLNQSHLSNVGAIAAGQSTVTDYIPSGLDCLSHDIATTKSYAIGLYRLKMPDARHERVDLRETPVLCSNYLISTQQYLENCEEAELVAEEPRASWSLWMTRNKWESCF